MRRDWLMQALLKERLVVTLKDGQTFRGLLEHRDDRNLTLLDVEYLKADGATKVDGRVYLPRDHIAYVQRP